MQINRSISATFLGFIALMMWSYGPCLIMSLQRLPIFETMTFLYATALLASLFVLTRTKQWPTLSHSPKRLWLITVLAIMVNDILYIAAFKFAPAIHVGIIGYLWPVLVILFSFLIPGERFHIKNTLAALLAFIGVYFMLTNGQGIGAISSSYTFGYVLALGAACSWCMYNLFGKYFKQFAPASLVVNFAVGFCVFLSLHIGLENFVMPRLTDIVALLILGSTGHCAAYFLWDYAIKKGHFYFLHISSYIAPLTSTYLLIFFGYGHANEYSWLAALLLLIAGLINLIKKPTKRPDISPCL